MDWPPQQLESLYANIYRNSLTCPTCAGRLAVTRSSEPGEWGTVHCPACDRRHLVSTGNDPAAPRFRPYTDDERHQIIAADRRRQSPPCPVDGTTMDVHTQRSLGLNSNVTVRCRRCGQSVAFTRKHG